MIRAGLFLYDHLAPRKRLAASSSIDLRTHIAGEPLQPGYRRGFVYSDGWVDDARLHSASQCARCASPGARASSPPHSVRAPRARRGRLERHTA